MSVDKAVADARGRIMRESRRGGNPEKAVKARAELAEAKIAAYVREALSVAPPLSDEQIDRLSSLLRPAGA